MSAVRAYVLQGEIQGGQRRDDGGFGAQDQFAERSFPEAAAPAAVELVIGPATFGADGQGGLRPSRARQNFAQWRCRRCARKAKFSRGGSAARKASPGRARRRDRGNSHAARLLRRLDQNFLPTLGALSAAASEAFSLRAAATGTIVLTPSSVAFSIAHSKASNFTMESSRVMSTAG